jgi:glycosyltransferase involved in cell wall biosynthesis
LKILQVTEFFIPSTGGSTQVVYQISRHLASFGYQVTVCTSNFGQHEPQFSDINFTVKHFLSLPTKWKFYVTPGLIPWTCKHLAEFDIIHMHNLRTFQNAVIAAKARKIGIPYIVSAHGSLPYLIGHHTVKRITDFLFARRLIKDATRLVAVSGVGAAQYLEAGVPREKIEIIHNGLDLEEFTSLPERGIFRGKYNLSAQLKIILFLGRLHKIKRVDHLIHTVNQLISQGLDVVLLIAGPDDGELSSLKEMVTKLSIESKVIFTGPLFGRDKLSAYVDADALISPGEYEIFGLVPFEALMCGTPVIVSDDSGLGQLIKDATAGYTIPPGDVNLLAAKIRHILQEPEEAKQKVATGQHFIHENLDWNKITNKYIKLYQGCIAQRH